MVSKGEGRAHPTGINRCFHMREKVDYHESAGLEVAPDAGGEYDLFVPNG